MSITINKTISLSLLVIVTVLMSSCTESIFDILERNKVVFWFNEETSRQLLDDNAETLTFYINDVAVATSPVDDIYWTTAPSCDDSTSITAQVDVRRSANTIIIRVKDQTGFEYYSGMHKVYFPNCNAIEIGPITKFK